MGSPPTFQANNVQSSRGYPVTAGAIHISNFEALRQIRERCSVLVAMWMFDGFLGDFSSSFLIMFGQSTAADRHCHDCTLRMNHKGEKSAADPPFRKSR